MIRLTLFMLAAVGTLALADRAAGGPWAILVAVGAVVAVFGCDRVSACRHGLEEIGRDRKRSRVYRTRNLRKVV